MANGQRTEGGGDDSGTGKIRGTSVNGAPGDTLLGPKTRWDPTGIPERAAHSEADDSVDLSSLGRGRG